MAGVLILYPHPLCAGLPQGDFKVLCDPHREAQTSLLQRKLWQVSLLPRTSASPLCRMGVHSSLPPSPRSCWGRTGELDHGGLEGTTPDPDDPALEDRVGGTAEGQTALQHPPCSEASGSLGCLPVGTQPGSVPLQPLNCLLSTYYVLAPIDRDNDKVSGVTCTCARHFPHRAH